MAIQDSDLFLIDDAGVSKKIRADKLKGGLDSTYANMKLLVNKPDYSSRFIYCKDLQSNLPDDHWLMVERSDVSYKVNGTDVHDYFPSGLADQTGVITDSHSPGTPTATCETELIANVVSQAADYSSSLTCPNGFASPASRAFNGETVTSGPGYFSGGTTCFPNGLATWQWSKEINFSILKIYAFLHSNKPTSVGYVEVKNATSGWIQLNGFIGEEETADFNNAGIDTGLDVTNQVSALNGKIDGCRFEANGSTGWGLWGIEIDGYLLVDGNTEVQLTFPSDQGFDCFRNGDVVQVDDSTQIIDIDADNNQITVNGGDWTGTDGTNSGSAPQDDKLVSTSPRLTVASLATPNFVDNESIRMVSAAGETSSYVPVTNTITNVTEQQGFEYKLYTSNLS